MLMKHFAMATWTKKRERAVLMSNAKYHDKKSPFCNYNANEYTLVGKSHAFV